MNSQSKPMKGTKKKNECKICNKIMTCSSFNFKAHLYWHKKLGARFNCEYCSNEYFRKDSYEKHVKAHSTGKRIHICDHCGRGFEVKINLRYHLKLHEEYFTDIDFKYKCIACGAIFCEERLLKYHIRRKHFNYQNYEPKYIHKRLNETWIERVLESEVCVEMTKVDENVINIKKSSVKMEIKKKPETRFKEYMSSVFASKDRSQYAKAVCDYCKKVMVKKSLLNHIRETHLRLKKFSCKECKRSYNRRYQLVDHVCDKKRPYRK